MTRTMYDGIDANAVPAGGDLYAGYVDGRWPDAAALGARYPGAVLVRIAVFATTDDGDVLDVETGDATPEEAVGWVRMRRAAGVDPTVYCNTSTWPQVRAAFQGAGVAEPHYWIAQYDGVPVIPAGAVGKQYLNTAGYDQSVIADYWPGIDPAPNPAPPTIPLEDDMPYLISVTPDPTNTGTPNTGSGIFIVDGAHVVHVVDGESLTNLSARFGAPVAVTVAQYGALLAATAQAPVSVTVDAAQVAAALAPLLPAAPTADAVAAAVVKHVATDLAAG